MPLAAVAILALLAGCASVSEPTARKNAELGPAFTEEEKAAMTDEETVAIYNEEQDDRQELVCRRERLVGTRMTKTVCRTRAEIEEESKSAQEAIRPAKGYSQGAGNWSYPGRQRRWEPRFRVALANRKPPDFAAAVTLLR